MQQLKHLARTALNIVLPPLCMSCEEVVSESHGFCASCWKDIRFIAPPHCATCGLPFEYEGQGVNAEALCGACLTQPPAFLGARAAVVYNEGSRKVLLPFKHSDRTDFAPALSRLMQQAGRGMLENADIIIPVPLHFMRFFSRRYNQAAMLAREVARLAAKPCLPDALIRHRDTPSQGRLAREQRFANVRNAFRLRPGARAHIAGKKVLLVDDVLTTGATADACAAVLLKGGAAQVDVLTFARVVKAEN